MRKGSKKSPGFTLIELLMVIAIIGVLATLASIALASVKNKARDARRISDIKQMQAALDLYFNEELRYPTDTVTAGKAAFIVGQPLTSNDGSKTYMSKVPSNPTPVNDGSCPADTQYVYKQTNGGVSYTLSYCLGGTTGNVAAGAALAWPGSINNQCTPNCSGKVCGSDGCGGSCGTCSGATPYCSANVCAVYRPCPSGATIVYNGITYNTVLIDYNSDGVEDHGECWFKENLATTKKPDGVTDLTHSTSGGYVCPPNTGNSAEDCTKVTDNGTSGSTSVLGYLYNWATAMNLASTCNSTDCSGSITAKHQGLCPSGWHIPTDDGTASSDLAKLVNYAEDKSVPTTGSICGTVGGCSNAGKVLKEVGTAYWVGGNSATNDLGLTLQGAGDFVGGWSGRGVYANLWSASQYSSNPASVAMFRYWYYSENSVGRYEYPKTYMFSVRCVKD